MRLFSDMGESYEYGNIDEEAEVDERVVQVQVAASCM
jgi:hypothetical protein